MNVFIDGNNIKIGENSVINRFCYLDGRSNLLIGRNVSISPYTKIITVSHDKNDKYFKRLDSNVIIDDYVWIGLGAIILPGVHLKKGCVVSAGSVVTKNVEEYKIVAGVPAKVIADRKNDLNYNTSWFPAFD
jgi:maltose O-acetyltransferase